MTQRNELHVSVSRRIGGGYVINAFHDAETGGRIIFPAGTDHDVVMLRTWDETQPTSTDTGRHTALNAHDLWLIAQIKRAGTKKRAAQLAAQLAGLADRT